MYYTCDVLRMPTQFTTTKAQCTTHAMYYTCKRTHTQSRMQADTQNNTSSIPQQSDPAPPAPPPQLEPWRTAAPARSVKWTPA